MDKIHFQVPEGVTDLSIGAPGQDLLARSRELFRKGSELRCAKPVSDLELFQYGAEEGPTSYIYFLSKMLSQGYNDQVDMDDLMLTSGASAGLFLAAAVLMDQDCVLFVESQTYFLVLNILKDLGLTKHVVPIPMEEDGLDIEYLEIMVKKYYRRTSDNDRFWGLLYTIPTFHNPTGVCLSEVKSRRLIQMSREFDFLVICDDVYNLLHYTDDPPKRLVAFDKEMVGKRHVISNGTFSKILAPGIRVGWIETSPEIKNKLTNCGVIVSGGSLNSVAAGVIAMGMESGLQLEHIQHLRQIYKDRMETVVRGLKQGLPSSFKVIDAKGGYFVWITGPEDFDCVKFQVLCETEMKVKFLVGSKCSSISDSAITDDLSEAKIEQLRSKNCFRISIAFYPTEILRQAVHKICKALEMM